LCSSKELSIPRVRTRPAALNKVNAQLIKLLANLELVFNGKGNTFLLGTIPESGIVKLHFYHEKFP
jgi:hypothetical protein